MKTKEAVRYCMRNPKEEWSNCNKIAKFLKKHPEYIRRKRREILKEESIESDRDIQKEKIKTVKVKPEICSDCRKKEKKVKSRKIKDFTYCNPCHDKIINYWFACLRYRR